MSSSVSFVIPCLDEADSLPLVLDKIDELRRGAFAGREVEVVVADNGSTDGSPEIARERGARVEHCQVRGYGAALRCGIEGAGHDVVVFADADNTYDFLETPALVAKLEEGNDLVLGSRVRGQIHPGAMPFLHRYLGTPVLTFWLNLLHAGRGQRVSDCNSGFRCFRRDRFDRWGVRSDGMEFASEMLIKAMRSGDRIAEVPISLHPDTRERAPHLKRWRDGMRHLLEILAQSPRFFSRLGLLLFTASWAVLVVGLLWGPITLPMVNLFGLHTMMFALLGTCLGLNIFGIGLLLYAGEARMGTGDGDRSGHTEPLHLYVFLLALDEGRLFWGGLLFLAASVAVCVPIVADWAGEGYRFLALEKRTLVLVAFGANGIFFLFNLIAAFLVRGR